MINVLVPMSGASLYSKSEQFIYPKILTELANKTLFEYSQIPFVGMKEEKKITYMLPKRELNEFGLASIIGIVSPGDNSIIELNGSTGGALCTCLMAIDEIDGESELIITSADHCILEDMDEAVEFFRLNGADAGVLTFESVHPKWSYAKLDENGLVCQTSEKKPISRHAMAGFTYFKRANDFFSAAQSVIRKQAMIDGVYYVSSCLNEMILMGLNVCRKPLSDGGYFNFYDAHAIKSFEYSLGADSRKLKDLSRSYVQKFHARDLDCVLDMFHDDAVLIDPNVNLQGKDSIHGFLSEFFSSVESLDFIEKNIVADKNKTMIEFELAIDGNKYKGVDSIVWKGNKIVSLDAYLY